MLAHRSHYVFITLDTGANTVVNLGDMGAQPDEGYPPQQVVYEGALTEGLGLYRENVLKIHTRIRAFSRNLIVSGA